MSQTKPTYEELEQRCHKAEAMLEAIRSGQADTIIGEQGVLVLRLAEAEEALRLNRERLSLALDAAQAGAWEWNLKTNENFWSEALWSVYGLELHCCQPSYEAWLRTIHPADRAGAAQAVQTAAANATELNAEWRVLDRDGTERWLMSRGRPVRDAAGEVVRYIGIVFDITERKRTEEALRESENTVRAWLDAIQESAFMMDPGGTILAANATTARRLHRTVEEMVGACIYDLIPPQNAHERRVHVAQVIESGQPVRFEDIRAGHIFDHLIYPVFDQTGQVKHLAILGTDITERRQAEAALRESEAKYRLLAENMADVIWILNANSLRFTYVSPSVERLRGYSVAEVIAQPIEQVMTPDSLAQINARFPERLQAFLAGDPNAVTQTHEVEQLRQDGSTVWTEVVTTLLRNEAGEIEVLGVSRDISARKQAEDELRENRLRLELALKGANAGLWDWYVQTGQAVFNQRWAEIVGYTLEELEPINVRTWIDRCHPDDLARSNELLKQHFAGKTDFYECESRMRHKNGEWVWVLDRGQVVEWAGPGQPIRMTGTYMDITERKQAEAKLQASTERFNAFFFNAPLQGVLYRFIRDPEGEIIDWEMSDINPMGAASLSQPAEALVGQRASEMFGQEVFGPYLELSRQVAATGQSRLFETHFETNGRDYLASVFMVGADHYANVSVDITERKRAERELHIALEKYRVLFETFPLGISVTDAAGSLIEVNQESERLLGLSRQDHMRRTFDGPEWRIVRPDRTPMPPDEYASVRALQEKRLVENVEMGIVKSDGEITWINVTAAPIPLEGYGVVIAYGDITQRKRTEEALRESEERYRKLLELAPVAIAVHSDGKIVFINPAGVRLLGADSEEELIGRSVLDIIHPVGLNQVQERKTRLLAGEEGLYPVEDVYLKLDGTPINVEATVTPLSYQGKPAFQAIVTDITERKRAADALRESEAFIKAILDNLPIGIAVNSVDPTVTFNYMNDNFPKFYRTTRENLTDSDGFWEAVYEEPKFREEMKQKVLADCASGDEERMIWVDIPITRHGADTHFITAKNIPIPGKPLMISTVWDVTERKRAEDELNRLNAELEQRVAQRTAELTDLYNNAPCGYHSLDGNGIFVRINDTELAWLGYTREEIIGRVRFPDLLTPASLQTFTENFPVFKERGWVQDLEFDLVRKDGSILPVLLSASVIYDQAGRYLTSRSTMMDHTERRRAETALRESQAQLEAANKELEAFAYSVSHDLRAPLRGIDGWSLALLEDYGEQLNGTALEYLDRVRTEAQRMGRLIDDMLQLSRVTRADMKRSPVNLAYLAHTIVARLKEAQPERQVTVIIQPNLIAQGDPHLLEIMLTNLFDNAFKFSSHRAEARIEFGCLPHASSPSPSWRGEGGEVYFVRDNGAGFNMAYASKLFGAFQRMHKASEFPGTGIGLAIVQRIIHRHGGQVWAETEVGQGATFYFTLEEDPKADYV